MTDMGAFEAAYAAPLNLAQLQAGERDNQLVRHTQRRLNADRHIAALEQVRADYERARTALLGY